MGGTGSGSGVWPGRTKSQCLCASGLSKILYLQKYPSPTQSQQERARSPRRAPRFKKGAQPSSRHEGSNGITEGALGRTPNRLTPRAAARHSTATSGRPASPARSALKASRSDTSVAASLSPFLRAPSVTRPP